MAACPSGVRRCGRARHFPTLRLSQPRVHLPRPRFEGAGAPGRGGRLPAQSPRPAQPEPARAVHRAGRVTNDGRSAIHGQMKSRFLSLFATTASRWVTVIVVCAVTLGAVGAVLVTTTSFGCTASNKLGVKNVRCVAQVAALTTPTPFSTSRPTVSAPATPRGEQSSSPTPPLSPATATPSAPQLTNGTLPIVGPLSSAYPPFQPGSSTASGAFVPDIPLTCRLPVYAGPPGSGGFIQFPGGNFVADPASAVTLPPVTPAATPQPQYGYQTALSYDQPLARWVPVAHNAVSPDGTHYAFVAGSDLYLVDVKPGT